MLTKLITFAAFFVIFMSSQVVIAAPCDEDSIADSSVAPATAGHGLVASTYAPNAVGEQLKWPAHIALGPGKQEIITDLKNNRFLYRDNPGAAWQPSPVSVKGPHSLVYNPADQLYYCNDTANHRIIAFADLSRGTIAAQTSSIAGVTLKRPHDILIDPATGWIYALNPNSGHVFRFTAIGENESAIKAPTGGYARAISLVKGKIYVIGSAKGRIVEIVDWDTATFQNFDSRDPTGRGGSAGSWSKTGLVLNDVEFFDGYWYATSYFTKSYANGTDFDKNKFIRFKTFADFEAGNWEDLNSLVPSGMTPYFLSVNGGSLFLAIFNHESPGDGDSVLRFTPIVNDFNSSISAPATASEALDPLVSGSHYHVSPGGHDTNRGTENHPFKTISAAAEIAQPGDTIMVHGGIYRERINPPRGGTSDDKRITYQTAPGEHVVIKGSEVVTGWQKVQNDTWKAVLTNCFFGSFNPYADVIRGDWFNPKGRTHHTGAVYLNGHWLAEAAEREEVLQPITESPLWFAEVGEENTTIWAQFKELDPNENLVEVNVRQTVFYPSKPGIDYITVKGFILEQAATPWSPPTAEQIGLLGTHWSKAWVIEDNVIRYSVCAGITLGKHGDEFDNTSQNKADGYVETIKRGFAAGWSKAIIGHHLVRNNHISHCEQAGIAGSLGAIFSTISGNEIHDIHVRGLFKGVEMAGIKIHGAVDTLISGNHIYRCKGSGGIWLDWMAQGARVTQNLLHDNTYDLFMEVNHGPFLIDHNLFLSSNSLREWSQGGAYAHNLFAGSFEMKEVADRETPYFNPHSVQNMKLSTIEDKDLRFHNNLLLEPQDLSSFIDSGNLLVDGVLLEHDEKKGDFLLHVPKYPTEALAQKRALVTTDLLAKAKIPDAPFVNADGTPYRLDTDYFGKKRNSNPAPGPFVIRGNKKIQLKVWPSN